MPGSPLDPRAEGTIDLLRSGAALCAGIDDVLSVLDPMVARGPPASLRERPEGETEPLWDELDLPDVIPAPAHLPTVPDLPEAGVAADAVIALLGPSPIGVDELVRQSGRPVRDVQRCLLELELDGRLERHGGNAVSLVLRAT